MLRPSTMLAVAACALVTLSASLSAEEPADWAKKNLAELVALYREFHRHPELSYHEEQTAERVAKEWKQLGADVTAHVGGYGVVGLIKNGPGPTLMLRTDLDALPVVEDTGLVYASHVKMRNSDGVEVGVMHACGHDLHMTNLIGVARYLASNKERWSGTLMLVGQPAEERGNGAKRMLDDGLFERFPKPDYALALHVDSTLETGKVAYRAGYNLANVDTVDVTIRGRGGHGAAPHTTIDPIVLAAKFVLDLQTLVSREVNPVEPAVVTVGAIQGGTKHNVIPDACHLQITVRSYSSSVRKQLLDGIERKAKAAAASGNAPDPVVTFAEETTPAVYNNDKLVERVVPAFQRALGDKNVVDAEPVMGGEDFSFYGKAGVPIFMFRLGSVEAKRLAGLKRGGQQPPSLHSAVYYPDAEEALATGITAMTAAALELLPKK